MSYVGLDIGKKGIEAVRLETKESKPERNRFGTDTAGMRRLTTWLKVDDCVGLETGSLSKFVVTVTEPRFKSVVTRFAPTQVDFGVD